MDIIFFGSDQFAVPSLEALVSGGYNISCVVTQPDREKGRGLRLEGTPVKKTAKKLNLKIIQPLKINSETVLRSLKELNPGLFVVVAYGQILSKEVLSIPKILALNIHASLLPKYRGAAPVNWAIINGEKITGVTAMKITEKMDAGPIFMQEAVAIGDNDTAVVLSEKLSRLGASLLIKTLETIEKGSYKLIPQDEKDVSFAPKLKKQDGLINWKQLAQGIHSLIRGFYEWPNAFTYYKGKLLKIYKASVFISIEKEGIKPTPGEIVKVIEDGIIVSCGRGDLVIEELQIEGKRRMQAQDFIAGHKICIGEILGEDKLRAD